MVSFGRQWSYYLSWIFHCLSSTWHLRGLWCKPHWVWPMWFVFLITSKDLSLWTCPPNYYLLCVQVILPWKHWWGSPIWSPRSLHGRICSFEGKGCLAKTILRLILFLDFFFFSFLIKVVIIVVLPWLWDGDCDNQWTTTQLFAWIGWVGTRQAPR